MPYREPKEPCPAHMCTCSRLMLIRNPSTTLRYVGCNPCSFCQVPTNTTAGSYYTVLTCASAMPNDIYPSHSMSSLLELIEGPHRWRLMRGIWERTMNISDQDSIPSDGNREHALCLRLQYESSMLSAQFPNSDPLRRPLPSSCARASNT